MNKFLLLCCIAISSVVYAQEFEISQEGILERGTNKDFVIIKSDGKRIVQQCCKTYWKD